MMLEQISWQSIFILRGMSVWATSGVVNTIFLPTLTDSWLEKYKSIFDPNFAFLLPGHDHHNVCYKLKIIQTEVTLQGAIAVKYKQN